MAFGRKEKSIKKLTKLSSKNIRALRETKNNKILLYNNMYVCPRTLVEIKLIGVCGAIRDRKNWWNKIGNSQIVNTWAKEAQSQGVNNLQFQYALAEAVSLAEQICMYECVPTVPVAHTCTC